MQSSKIMTAFPAGIKKWNPDFNCQSKGQCRENYCFGFFSSYNFKLPADADPMICDLSPRLISGYFFSKNLSTLSL
jgi:hypothetical protein